MNNDILTVIYNNIQNIHDVFNFRLINKSCNNIFKDEFNNIIINICPRSSFLNIKECQVCYSKKKPVKKFIYKHDCIPYSCLTYCNNKYCKLTVIKRYLLDIKKNNIYPFCSSTNQFILDNYDILINHNNKYIQKYKIESLKKYNNNWYIKLQYTYMCRYHKLNSIKNILNYNLFSWFLYRNITL